MRRFTRYHAPVQQSGVKKKRAPFTSEQVAIIEELLEKGLTDSEGARMFYRRTGRDMSSTVFHSRRKMWREKNLPTTDLTEPSQPVVQ